MAVAAPGRRWGGVVITAPLKAELLEVFDKAMKDLSSMVRALDDVSNLVFITDRDLRLSHSLLVGELGNSLAQMDLIRYRIDEAKTYEDRRRGK
ncbi:hypothetical protein ACWEOG_12200 [Amycolatopsis japonica]|uniref:hypothetical protein n=1 Tax=Amycolatopsis sp. MJM2582 TaxID=1427749 RepID=UPI00126A531D|nr:hypothetical protein [Amycolatopsis sp. MJM2582]